MHIFLALTILLTPTYAIRFNVFGLPTNVLMLWVFLVWLVWLSIVAYQKRWQEFVGCLKKIDKKILILMAGFFLAGCLSLFTNGFSQKKLAQFLVLFVQPMSLFFIASFEWRQNPSSKNLLLATCYLLLGLMGVYSILQYFALVGLPLAYWGNNVEPKRALAFFSHPNFYSLFAAPLLAYLLPDAGRSIKYWKITAGLLGAIGLGLSLSRAGWLGLGAAGLVYLFFAAGKKIRELAAVIVVIITIIILAVPNLRWRLALPFYGEKSAVSRLSLWQTGWKAIKQSPITGLGLSGFGTRWQELNTDQGLPETHNFPHNIFLDLWVETGLLGLISLTGLIGLLIFRGLRLRSSPPIKEGSPAKQGEVVGIKDKELKIKDLSLAVSLFLIALLFQGLIDNPYFKNDLAMVFWTVLAFIP